MIGHSPLNIMKSPHADPRSTDDCSPDLGTVGPQLFHIVHDILSSLIASVSRDKKKKRKQNCNNYSPNNSQNVYFYGRKPILAMLD